MGIAYFIFVSTGSDSGIVEARKHAHRVSNGLSVEVQRQINASGRPDSVIFTNIMDDFDQMAKELDSCLIEECSTSCEPSGVI